MYSSRIEIKSTPLSCYVTESHPKFQVNIYYKNKIFITMLKILLIQNEKNAAQNSGLSKGA